MTIIHDGPAGADKPDARTLNMVAIFKAVARERQHQLLTHGDDDGLTLKEMIAVVGSELDEARFEASRGRNPKALAELLQVAAVCFAAIEKFGLYEEVRSSTIKYTPFE